MATKKTAAKKAVTKKTPAKKAATKKPQTAIQKVVAKKDVKSKEVKKKEVDPSTDKIKGVYLNGNLKLNIDGTSHSIKITKEDYVKNIQPLLEKYNTSTNKSVKTTYKNKLIKALTPNSTAKIKEQEKTEAVAKGTKKLIKKEESKKSNKINTELADKIEKSDELIVKEGVGKVIEAVKQNAEKVNQETPKPIESNNTRSGRREW